MCYHIYVIMHVKDLQLSVVRVGHHLLVAGFCLSLYDQHVLYGDVSMINKSINYMHLCMIQPLIGMLIATLNTLQRLINKHITDNYFGNLFRLSVFSLKSALWQCIQ